MWKRTPYRINKKKRKLNISHDTWWRFGHMIKSSVLFVILWSLWFGNFQQQLHSLLRAKQEADKFRRWTWFLFSHGNIEWIRSWHLKLPFFHMYSSTQQGRMLFTCFLYWKYFGLGDGSACMKHAGGRDIHPLTVNLFYTCSVLTYAQSKNCTREPAG